MANGRHFEKWKIGHRTIYRKSFDILALYKSDIILSQCPASTAVPYSLDIWAIWPYVATGHTSAFISRIFVEIGMLLFFHIFCSDAPIACPENSSYTHHSVIKDPIKRIHLLQLLIMNEYAARYVSFAIILVLTTLMSRLYLWLTRSRRSMQQLLLLPPKWPTGIGWCH